MNWIINNWYILIALLAIVTLFALGWVKFLKLPNSKQVEAVKQWLIYACMEAEKLLGSKTGLLKLRYVYDLFVTKFPWLAQVITFEYFSLLVDEALETVRKQLESNSAVRNLVIPNSTEGVGKIDI